MSKFNARCVPNERITPTPPIKEVADVFNVPLEENTEDDLPYNMIYSVYEWLSS